MDQSDELIRRVLDERSLEALSTLKHINKEKGEMLQSALAQHFYSVRRPISYSEYIEIAKKIEEKNSKPSVNFRRRGNFFELDDI
ncbi:Pdcd5 programmed cell death 5-like protein [Encephalitozoon intestinalis ATCC 50506]|uniref:Pdcd5 programmed cell death 5-like protein n=1 Tax=Encephalitozoon intestinalis (strain ATCC 50506) TaxID=876142 RepID=E0SA02_ENCIT|nr:Pdcd5 programmed cell death 5-like protein [Encephalitozoon intestinalis ATCC 50506]ADM12624.1 Pdcd5 programmed cell death 5-like protein [Encephalitozoon intestinalis ATCC 50506]UTX46483.1 putative programmed cell death protein 5 [Encephalitozoon intestinalis]